MAQGRRRHALRRRHRDHARHHRQTAPTSTYLNDGGSISILPTRRDELVVSAYVDSDNSFGAKLRSDFTCTVITHDGGNSWDAVQIDILK